MSPRPYACESPNNPNISAACMNHLKELRTAHPEVVSTGTYQPLPYLLPAVALRLSGRASAALRFGRLANAGEFLALLAGAVLVLWGASDGMGWMIGLLLAVTPMVIFTGASIQPSGLEIGSAMLLISGFLRIGDSERPTRGTWAAIAIGGSALALSRSTSPAWVVVIGVFAFAWIGREHLVRLARLFPIRASLTIGAILVALLLNRAWEAAYGPTVPYNMPSGSLLAQAFGQFSAVYRQEIGDFGYLETGMSELAYKAWTIALTALVALALLVGARRERRVLLGAIVANGVAPALLFTIVMYKTGFGVQGRYVLPLAVLLPLCAGYTILRNRHRFDHLRPQHLITYFALIAAGVQLAGWYANARRHAVGTKGPVIFFGRSQWKPPLGWWPWALLALLGALTLVVAGALADRLDLAALVRKRVTTVNASADGSRSRRRDVSPAQSKDEITAQDVSGDLVDET
jgi:hypothetical protein